jgi:predicted AAA+ superfamily ATPase
MAHIGRSSIDGVSFSSLSKNLGITKYKVEEYLKVLVSAYLIQILYPKGANVIKEPKILLSLPFRFLYRTEADAIGGIREDFVVEMLRAQKLLNINYLKGARGEKIPDFLIEDDLGREIVIEVGGRGKGRSQFKGITVTTKVVFVDSLQWKEDQIPLFMLGMY